MLGKTQTNFCFEKWNKTYCEIIISTWGEEGAGSCALSKGRKTTKSGDPTAGVGGGCHGNWLERSVSRETGNVTTEEDGGKEGRWREVGVEGGQCRYAGATLTAAHIITWSMDFLFDQWTTFRSLPLSSPSTCVFSEVSSSVGGSSSFPVCWSLLLTVWIGLTSLAFIKPGCFSYSVSLWHYISRL